MRIARILRLSDSDWEQPSDERTADLVEELRAQRPEVFGTAYRSMHAEVVGRRKQFVSVELDNGERADVDLETVGASFVPMVGDMLVLNCRVQTDPAFVDMAGHVLEVMSLDAARTKCCDGVVTSLELARGFGVVNRILMFAMDALDVEYVQPQKGDRVRAEAVECSQRAQYAWRCLKVVLVEGAGGAGSGAGDGKAATAADASAGEAAQMEIELKKNKQGLVVGGDLNVS